MSDPQVVAALIAGAVAILGPVLVFKGHREKLRQERRMEDVAETAIILLLEHPRWKQRSFTQVSARLGGIHDDELRRLLVRAGAVRFMKDGDEYWGLLDRNRDALNSRDSGSPAAGRAGDSP
jgi:hypothetical protein